MSYGYGGRPNPFDQRDGGGGGGGYGAQGGGYGAPQGGYGGAPQGGYGGAPQGGYGGAPQGGYGGAPQGGYGGAPQGGYGGPPGGGLPSGPRGGGGGGNRYNQAAPAAPAPAMGREDYGGYNGGGGNVEMAPLAQNAGSFGQGNPNAILNECREIDRGIDDIERNLEQLKMLQQRALDDSDSSASSSTNRQVDQLSSETMTMYRSFTDRVRKVKSNPESRSAKNTGQVGRVDRRLKQAIQQFQQVESQFRKKSQDQMARQYKIVRPDASESEVRAAVEDANGGQVFQQAMMQSNRQGQAQAVLSAVRDRHAQIQKIEQQMIELAQLFQDMDTLVMQQDEAVAQIEQKGEEVVDNLDKGNEEIGTAIVTARSTRKKKWICLGIAVLIVVLIAGGIAVWQVLMKQNTGGNGKRELKDTLHHGQVAWPRYVVPGQDWSPEAAAQLAKRYAVLDADWQAEIAGAEKEKRFAVPGGIFVPADLGANN